MLCSGSVFIPESNENNHMLVFILSACVHNGPAWWTGQTRGFNGQQESLCTRLRHAGKQLIDKILLMILIRGSVHHCVCVLNVNAKTETLSHSRVALLKHYFRFTTYYQIVVLVFFLGNLTLLLMQANSNAPKCLFLLNRKTKRRMKILTAWLVFINGQWRQASAACVAHR